MICDLANNDQGDGKRMFIPQRGQIFLFRVALFPLSGKARDILDILLKSYIYLYFYKGRVH